MSHRQPDILAAAALLALLGPGCGAVPGEEAGPGETPELAEAPLSVVPRLELKGVNGRQATVAVEELLLHVAEVRLTSTDEEDGGEELVSAPLWVRFTREGGEEVHGAAAIEVPPGDYAVSVALAPAERTRRTAGELHGASVVVRGVCLAFESGIDEPGSQDGPPSFNPGYQDNNPVPMPARPKAQPTGGRLIRIPFTFATASSLSVDLGTYVELRAGAADLTVSLDVARWMAEAVHPIVAEAATAPDHKEGKPVDLRFGEESQDPRAEAFRRALEQSMAGALSAELAEI